MGRAEIKYQGGQELFWWFLIAGGLYICIQLYEQGVQPHIFQALILLLFLLKFIYLIGHFTSVTIKDGRHFLNKVGFGRGFTCDIYNVSKIERTSVFVFKNWGSRLQIYFTDESSKETWRVIQESTYNVETIKALLTKLKEINSSIKLDSQYQDIIDGKIEDESGFKRLLPTK